MNSEEKINVWGARVHNLKNVDLEIPRRKLVVITGLSGSGKSSLAFDTIYAEGQRRYMETLSTYARQFVGTMERPDVDKITGLSPVVAIEQKTTNKNPRSTVGTVTEINDFLRLLYARASRAYSPVTGEEMVHYTDERIAELILSGFAGRRIAVMAPVVKGRKGHYRELFETLARKGYIYARIDGEIREISAGMRLDRYKIHTIDLVVDRLVVGGESAERLMTSLREAMRQGKGTMAVYDYGTEQQRFYSRHLMCPSTGIAFEDPAPHTFSFNSPKGACPHCNGLGEEAVFDLEKIVPDPGLSLREGAVEPLGKYRNNLLFAMLEMLGRRYDFTLDDPVSSFSEEGLNAVLYGDSEPLTVDLSEFSSSGGRQFLQWEGVAEYIGRTEDEDSKRGQKWRDQFLIYRKCSVCGAADPNYVAPVVNPFKDVKEGDAFYDEILWAADKGIIKGDGTGNYNPNDGITRAQIVMILWNATGNEEASKPSGFADVKDGAWYAKAVAWAVENGITNGTDLGFEPDRVCTRAEIVTFLHRANNKPAPAAAASFSDLTQDWYKDAVAWAVENGITKGVGGNRFAPNDTCTRGQAAAFMYRLAQLAK